MTTDRKQRKRRPLLRAFARDERGAVAVIAAVLFPFVVGGMGLGAETGYWHLKQRKLQHAADVAAHAAAIRKQAGDQSEKMEAAALTVATASGYLPSVGTLEVAPASGATASASRIAVVLTETHPRFFSSFFVDGPAVISARAVAEVTGGARACVLALSGSAPGAITVSGSTSVGLTDCSVASNSNAADAFNISGAGSSITTDCVYTVGEAVIGTALKMTKCSTPVEHAPKVADPYADVPEPEKLHVDQLPCRDASELRSSYTMDLMADGTPAFKLCGTKVELSGTIVLKPGLYIINGGELSANGNAIVDGTSGVTFYFAGSSSSKLPGNGDLDLKAQSTGPYTGILFFGNRSATAVSHVVTGNSVSTFQGSIYMPRSHLTFTGNSTVSGACTQIIADRITFTGNSKIQTGCTSGMKDILVGGSVALVE